MARTKLSRRTMLKGILGGTAVAVALPTLDIFLDVNGEVLAQGGGFPKRFGWWLWGNGVLPDRWNPPGFGGSSWTPSEQLMPLDGVTGAMGQVLIPSVRDVVSVVSGMQVKVINDSPHGSGPSGLLSGGPTVPDGSDAGSFPGASIDQRIADLIALPTASTGLKSIEYAAERSTNSNSFNGPGSRNPAEVSPYALYSRIFGMDFVEPGQTPVIDPRWALRRGVLDAVSDQATRLNARLGRSDQIRMDEYFTGLRELEQRLAQRELDPPDFDSCVRPPSPAMDYPDIGGRQQLSEVHRAFADLMVMALACDVTRVFSCMFTQPVGNLLFRDFSEGHHELTHNEGVGQAQPSVHEIVLDIMTEYAYFVNALRQVPEGAGTLLDNCIVLGTSDSSFGRSHSIEDYPLLVAGAGGGALRQGVYYRSTSNESTSKLMLSIMRAMDILQTDYGMDDNRVTDGLGAIEV